MLNEMIEFQKMLQTKIYGKFDPSEMSYEEKVNMTKQFVLYCHEELSEVMSAMKYKSYHKYEKEYSEDDIKTEVIDCLKFVLNIGILWGMDSIEFEEIFKLKSVENLKRLTKHE